MSKKKRKEKRMKKAGAWKGFFFILPSLCGLILFYLLPYLDVIKRSFSSPVTGTFTGLNNYWLVFGEQSISVGCKKYGTFYYNMCPDSGDQFLACCGDTAKNCKRKPFKNRIFISHGDSCGVCCIVMERCI